MAIPCTLLPSLVQIEFTANGGLLQILWAQSRHCDAGATLTSSRKKNIAGCKGSATTSVDGLHRIQMQVTGLGACIWTQIRGLIEATAA